MNRSHKDHIWFPSNNSNRSQRSPWLALFTEKQEGGGGGGFFLFMSALCGRTVRFVSCGTVLVFFLVVLTGWSYGPLFSKSTTIFSLRSSNQPLSTPPPPHQPLQGRLTPPLPPPHKKYPQISCSSNPSNQTCPYNNIHTKLPNQSSQSCPSYFRWIHEDLRPWNTTGGITRLMLDKARRTAHFHLIIINNKLYIQRYNRPSIQTRDIFTIWGFVQLLRRYRLPDLELMFDCDDRPVVPSRELTKSPPPLFRYCSDGSHLDIVFPDWSFWGWVETNIEPWRKLLPKIKEGNKKVKWDSRLPYAYWKGNPEVCPGRKDLMKCNSTANWNTTRLYIQDWNHEVKTGFSQSHLQDQCTHMYKIYIEGWAWSVSEKYILACDSMTLMIKPRFHDFFSRALIPLKHYWPIRNNDKCRSLKLVVDWANNHTIEAKGIGEEGSRFVHEDLAMEMVYDYMFHLLNQYAKLQRFEPRVPPEAAEVCAESMVCDGGEEGGKEEQYWKRFIMQGLEKYHDTTTTGPCALPSAYEPAALRDFVDRKANLTMQVEKWESDYYSIKKNNSRQ